MLFLLFTVLYYSEIRCIVLYVLCILFVCLFFFSVPSIILADLLGSRCLLARVLKGHGL